MKKRYNHRKKAAMEHERSQERKGECRCGRKLIISKNGKYLYCEKCEPDIKKNNKPRWNPRSMRLIHG